MMNGPRALINFNDGTSEIVLIALSWCLVPSFEGVVTHTHASGMSCLLCYRLWWWKRDWEQPHVQRKSRNLRPVRAVPYLPLFFPFHVLVFEFSEWRDLAARVFWKTTQYHASFSTTLTLTLLFHVTRVTSCHRCLWWFSGPFNS